jgi:hypothetical protein
MSTIKSKYIPATLDSATRSSEYIAAQVAELEKATSTRKRPSLRDKHLKERLEGLRAMGFQTEYEMDKIGKLLDPKTLVKRVNQDSKELMKLNKADLAKLLAEKNAELEIERGHAEINNRVMEYLWHVVEGDQYRKEKGNDNKQTEREKNFEVDEKRMLEVLVALRQKYLPKALSWNEFPEYVQNVYQKYPKPEFEHEVRVVGEHKKLKGEPLAAHKKQLREEKATAKMRILPQCRERK